MSDVIENEELNKIANEVIEISLRRDLPRAKAAEQLEQCAQRAGDVVVAAEDEGSKIGFVESLRFIASEVRAEKLPW